MPESDSSIAVVIPARNAGTSLEFAVESILEQSRDDIEVVLVDHDSSDNTHGIMLNLARRDSRIQVHRCKGTFVEAANLAWQKTSADLIARMDADDFAYPDRISRQAEFLHQNPNFAGCATRVKILKRTPHGKSAPPDEGYARYEEWVNSVVSPERIAAERFVDSPLPNPSTMVRRSVLEAYDGFADPEWAEDYDFWLRLLENGEILGKVEDVLLDWFDGETRATRTIGRYSLDQFQNAKAHYLSRLDMVKERGVVVCGAGPIGKQFARLLGKRKIEIKAFCEVNKKQIGNRLRGIPVRDSQELSEYQGNAVAIASVGLAGARQQIRELAESSGFIEGTDFFCVA